MTESETNALNNILDTVNEMLIEGPTDALVATLRANVQALGASPPALADLPPPGALCVFRAGGPPMVVLGHVEGNAMEPPAISCGYFEEENPRGFRMISLPPAVLALSDEPEYQELLRETQASRHLDRRPSSRPPAQSRPADTLNPPACDRPHIATEIMKGAGLDYLRRTTMEKARCGIAER